MAFCTKCGKQLSDGQAFCSSCGNKVQAGNNYVKPNSNVTFNAIPKKPLPKFSDIKKKIFPQLKMEFPKMLRIAFAFFIGFILGDAVIDIVDTTIDGVNNGYLFFSNTNIDDVFLCLIKLLLSGIFILIGNIPFLKKGARKINKKVITFIFLSAFSILLISRIMRILSFSVLAGDFYAWFDYAIEILVPIATALYVFNVRPKTPIFPMIVLLIFMPSYYVETLEILYFIFVAVSFLGYWLIPKKEKLVCSLLGIAVIVYDLIENTMFMVRNSCFSTYHLLNPLRTGTFIFLWLALIFALKKNHKNEEKAEEVKKVHSVKLDIIAVSVALVMFVGYVAFTGAIAVNYVNSNIYSWKARFSTANFTPADWEILEDELYEYRPAKIMSSFIPEYDDYETIKSCIYTARKVNECYREFGNTGGVSDDFYYKYKVIFMYDYWNNDPLLKKYYDMYMEMKPSTENVSVSNYGWDDNRITLKIRNDNKLRVEDLKIELGVTVLFIESDYSRSTYYGRDTEYITIDAIEGKTTMEKTITIDFDKYFDTYGSYILGVINNVSIKSVRLE